MLAQGGEVPCMLCSPR